MTRYRVQVTKLESYDVAVEASTSEQARTKAALRVKHGYEEPESADYETSTAVKAR